MKKLCLYIQLLCFALSGCGGGGGGAGGGGETLPPPVNPPVQQRSFDLIPMHYELLLGTPYLKNEGGGVNTADIVTAEHSTYTLSSTAGFHEGQLVVVETDADEYVTATIDTLTREIVTLSMAGKPLGTPRRLYNFYRDSIHPNIAGYRAIADFAVQYTGQAQVDHGTHVFIGDSWVAFEGIVQRASVLLPNATIINKGVAGNRISHILARFERDVVANNPDFVWVLVGTNDYRDRQTPAYYAENIKVIIDRIKAMGAVPIIFDPSVGPPFSPGYAEYEMTSLSHEYAAAVGKLP